MNQNNINVAFLSNVFREYYFKYGGLITVPYPVDRREFGFMHFDSIMTRHISFSNHGELIARLIKNTPSDVFCSNAYYKFPSSPIQEKQWDGADLIFDIDIKDMNPDCMTDHSFYICTKCTSCTRKKDNNTCDNCSDGKKFHTYIPCSKCLNTIKKETNKLVNFLCSDFGIQERNIELFFSGNAGYHIYVSNTTFRNLDSKARSDLIDYILGNGIMVESLGVHKFQNKIQIRFPKGGILLGWRKRITSELGITQKSIVKLKNIIVNLGGYDEFRKEINAVTKKYAVRVDSHVTTDIHRIFRLGGTINGKSGLTKIKCENLELFKPMSDACLISDREVNVKLKASLKLFLKNNHFKLNNSIEKIPAYAATYLICKGLADIIE